jgi:glycosyltransferase involved in cell wall biosynthesis
LAALISKERPDLIQANAGDTLKYAVLSKLFFRWDYPIVFRNASTISRYLRNSFARWTYAFLFRFVKHVVSVSQFSRLDFISTFPKMHHKVSVIPVAVDDSDEKVEGEALGGNPCVLHIGGFTFEKNHMGLLSIFEKFRQRYPDAILTLVGDGPLRKEIEDLVVKRRLKKNVVFLGYQHNPSRYFKSAKCLVLPSIIEGLPSVILEAFQCRVPVVAYAVGGVSEIVLPGETGWLIGAKDEPAFVSAMIDVLEHPVGTAGISERAYQLVTQQFGLEDVARRFSALYAEIAS